MGQVADGAEGQDDEVEPSRPVRVQRGLVTSLSAAAAAVQGVGAKLAQVTLKQCQDAAEAVLKTASAAQARAAALEVLG